MTAFPVGPYTLQIPMIWSELSHDLEVNCDVLGSPAAGADPSSVNLRTRNGDGAPLDDCANAFWDKVRPLFHLATLASTYTLWKRNTDNTDRVFVSGGTLTNLNGANIGAPNTPASQATLTWRSAGGHYMKLIFLEGVFSGSSRIPIASSTDPNVTALNGYITSGLNFVTARDRSFPVTPMNISYGQNEKVFQRRYRS